MALPGSERPSREGRLPCARPELRALMSWHGDEATPERTGSSVQPCGPASLRLSQEATLQPSRGAQGPGLGAVSCHPLTRGGWRPQRWESWAQLGQTTPKLQSRCLRTTVFFANTFQPELCSTKSLRAPGWEGLPSWELPRGLSWSPRQGKTQQGSQCSAQRGPPSLQVTARWTETEQRSRGGRHRWVA